MIYSLLGSVSSIRNYRGEGGGGGLPSTTSISYSAKVRIYKVCTFEILADIPTPLSVFYSPEGSSSTFRICSYVSSYFERTHAAGE